MGIAHDLIDLVLPASCICCGIAGDLWCAGCRPVSLPTRAAVPGPACFAAGEYDAELRTALLGFKERGHRGLLPALTGYLGDAVDVAVRASGLTAAALVPVPSRRAAARARGGDHVRRLARAVGRFGGHPVVPALHLTSPVADSAGLSVEQRAANLHRRMVAAPSDGTGPPLVVVDDIVTTGTTLAEAERALTTAGWTVAAAATVAATRRRWPDRAEDASPARARPRPDGFAGLSAQRDHPVTHSGNAQPFGWAERSRGASVQETYFKTGASARSNGGRAGSRAGSQLLLPIA